MWYISLDFLWNILHGIWSPCRYIPDIAISVYEHHDGADGATGLEEEDPAAVEKEEDGEAELDRVAASLEMRHRL